MSTLAGSRRRHGTCGIDARKLGTDRAGSTKGLTFAWNRVEHLVSRSLASLVLQLSRPHAFDSIEKTLSRRPFPHRTWPLRHPEDQEGHQNHPLFWAAAGFQEEKRRRDREQIPVRAQ